MKKKNKQKSHRLKRKKTTKLRKKNRRNKIKRKIKKPKKLKNKPTTPEEGTDQKNLIAFITRNVNIK